MTFTADTTTPAPDLDVVTVDLYRNIHKAIRAELFGLTAEAGRVDPNDAGARAELAVRVRAVIGWLDDHSHHEDRAIHEVLERLAPHLAAPAQVDHATLDARSAAVVALADVAASAVDDPGARVHRLYLELASFTSAYLAHQDTEERVIMTTLAVALDAPELLEIHHAILGSIPPAEMMRTLALMIPAINVDDRVELLGGLRAEAPAEVFATVWSLAGTVLAADELAALGERLGIA